MTRLPVRPLPPTPNPDLEPPMGAESSSQQRQGVNAGVNGQALVQRSMYTPSVPMNSDPWRISSNPISPIISPESHIWSPSNFPRRSSRPGFFGQGYEETNERSTNSILPGPGIGSPSRCSRRPDPGVIGQERLNGIGPSARKYTPEEDETEEASNSIRRRPNSGSSVWPSPTSRRGSAPYGVIGQELPNGIGSSARRYTPEEEETEERFNAFGPSISGPWQSGRHSANPGIIGQERRNGRGPSTRKNTPEEDEETEEPLDSILRRLSDDSSVWSPSTSPRRPIYGAIGQELSNGIRRRVRRPTPEEDEEEPEERRLINGHIPPQPINGQIFPPQPINGQILPQPINGQIFLPRPMNGRILPQPINGRIMPQPVNGHILSETANRQAVVRVPILTPVPVPAQPFPGTLPQFQSHGLKSGMILTPQDQNAYEAQKLQEKEVAAARGHQPPRQRNIPNHIPPRPGPPFNNPPATNSSNAHEGNRDIFNRPAGKRSNHPYYQP